MSVAVFNRVEIFQLRISLIKIVVKIKGNMKKGKANPATGPGPQRGLCLFAFRFWVRFCFLALVVVDFLLFLNKFRMWLRRVLP
jgi:hypothetical protein